MKNKLPISYLGDNFRNWFGNFKVTPKKCKLQSVTLLKPMTDREIEAEYHPEPVTLEEVAYHLETMSHDIFVLFYVKDKTDILRAVLADWSGGGWRLYARSVENPYGWGVGGRVVSRKFNSKTLSSSDTLPNTLIINNQKYVREK
jgi:hypothetical protein